MGGPRKRARLARRRAWAKRVAWNKVARAAGIEPSDKNYQQHGAVCARLDPPAPFKTETVDIPVATVALDTELLRANNVDVEKLARETLGARIADEPDRLFITGK